MWYQDFPLSTAPLNNEKTRFQSDLEDLLEKMTVPRPIIEALKPFDFSKATARLVASIPGTYTGSDLHKYGQLRLAKLVNEILPKETANEDRVVCYQVFLLLMC